MPSSKDNKRIYVIAWLAPFALWMIVTAGGMGLRPPTAPVELENLASAWHMLVQDHWIPLRNGQDSVHQPPLLLWLILVGWKFLGPVLWWPRLLSSIASLATLWFMGPITTSLWPRWPLAPLFARLILSGMTGFAITSTLIQPEIIALPFLAGGIYCLIHLWQKRGTSLLPWIGFALALIFIGFLLGWPMIGALSASAGLAPIFGRKSKARMNLWRWYASLFLSLLPAFVLLLAWINGIAIPFWAYANFWLFPDSEATRGDAWTLALAPLMLYPWIVWQTLWRAFKGQLRGRWGASIGLSVAIGALVPIACILAGTQLQGMLPVTLPLSLIGARLLSRVEIKAKDFHAAIPGLLALLLGLVFFLFNIIPTAHLDAVWREFFNISLPIWLGGLGLVSGLILFGFGLTLTQLSPSHQLARTLQVACLPVVLITCMNLEFPANLNQFFDLSPVASRLSDFQHAGKPIAVFGDYRGEFDYFGRLLVPPQVLPDQEAAQNWAKANPNGAVLSYFDGSPFRLPGLPYYRGVARDHWVAIWPASVIVETKGSVLRSHF